MTPVGDYIPPCAACNGTGRQVRNDGVSVPCPCCRPALNAIYNDINQPEEDWKARAEKAEKALGEIRTMLDASRLCVCGQPVVASDDIRFILNDVTEVLP